MPNTSQDLYSIPVRRIDGTDATLADYSGDVLLVVNVASACGLTPQYQGLQQLHQEFSDRGLRVLGFPCNQFGAQEPGTNEEIVQFCKTNYGVSFPMFDKIEVNGAQRHPLYQSLIAARPQAQPATPDASSDVSWNFEKFLVARNGEVIGRFSPRVTPEDSILRNAIEVALA
jgi:glutathione peroxidase